MSAEHNLVRQCMHARSLQSAPNAVGKKHSIARLVKDRFICLWWHPTLHKCPILGRTGSKVFSVKGKNTELMLLAHCCRRKPPNNTLGREKCPRGYAAVSHGEQRAKGNQHQLPMSAALRSMTTHEHQALLFKFAFVKEQHKVYAHRKCKKPQMSSRLNISKKGRCMREIALYTTCAVLEVFSALDHQLPSHVQKSKGTILITNGQWKTGHPSSHFVPLQMEMEREQERNRRPLAQKQFGTPQYPESSPNYQFTSAH